MPITMTSASVPVFQHYLGVLSDLLDKAEAHTLDRSISANDLLEARLYPDMHPLLGQVQFACDFAKGAVARLAGVENPSFADDEQTFAQLRARIDRTIAFIRSFESSEIEGSESRPVTASRENSAMITPF